MNFEELFYLVFGISVGILMALAVVHGGFYYKTFTNLIDSNEYTEEEIINKCAKDNIFDTSKCVNRKVTNEFNYQLTEDGENKTLTEIHETGGDCHDYSLVFKRIMEELNYSCINPVIDMSEDEGFSFKHTFTICSSNEGYVNFDLRDIEMHEFSDSNLTTEKYLEAIR